MSKAKKKAKKKVKKTKTKVKAKKKTTQKDGKISLSAFIRSHLEKKPTITTEALEKLAKPIYGKQIMFKKHFRGYCNLNRRKLRAEGYKIPEAKRGNQKKETKSGKTPSTPAEKKAILDAAKKIKARADKKKTKIKKTKIKKKKK